MFDLGLGVDWGWVVLVALGFLVLGYVGWGCLTFISPKAQISM